MAIKPSRPQGVTRISESENTRSLSKSSEKTNKIGQFCVACTKFYSYLRPEEKLCVACNSRKSLLK